MPDFILKNIELEPLPRGPLSSTLAKTKIAKSQLKGSRNTDRGIQLHLSACYHGHSNAKHCFRAQRNAVSVGETTAQF